MKISFMGIGTPILMSRRGGTVKADKRLPDDIVKRQNRRLELECIKEQQKLLEAEALKWS